MAFKSRSGEVHEREILDTENEQQEQIRSMQQRFAALEPTDIDAYVLIVRGKVNESGQYRIAVESGGLFKHKLSMLKEYRETLLEEGEREIQEEGGAEN